MEFVKLELFGSDLRINKAIEQAKNLASSKATVLISGENGVGKRSLASFIHNLSSRSNNAFEIVDCSLPPQDVENKILGFRDSESGRFNRGALEAGNKGTVVFANIDSLEEEFQKRLFKILNELEDYDIDIRLIATTTKSLSKLVSAGRFYRGLCTLFANNVVSIPSLRERPEDICFIARYFIGEVRGIDMSEIVLDQETQNKINSHYWTNNILELKQVIKRAEENNTSLCDDRSYEISENKHGIQNLDEESDGLRLMSLKDAEKLLIKKALIHTSENRTQAAKILGVSIRTLRNKINEYRTDSSSYFVNLR